MAPQLTPQKGGYGGGAPKPQQRYAAPSMKPSSGGWESKMLTASEGTCGVVDTAMWRQVPNAAVVAAIMFDRQSGLTCNECLANCVALAADDQWSCRSLTYDHRYEVCDLFAIVPNVMTGGANGAPSIRPTAPGGQGGSAGYGNGAPAVRPTAPGGQMGGGGYRGAASMSMMSNGGGYASSAMNMNHGGEGYGGGSSMASTGTGYALRIKRSAYGSSGGQDGGQSVSNAHLVPYPGRDFFQCVTRPCLL